MTCISGSIDDVMDDLESIKNGTKLFTVFACSKVLSSVRVLVLIVIVIVYPEGS